MMLCACQPIPPTQAPQILVQQCQTITPCNLPAMSPRTNGELQEALTTAKGAWATCAAKVDLIVECQARAQTRNAAQSKEAKHD
ncbi:MULTISPECIES: Rz1-like lysis system protein LysC [unclassified Caballeronia]|uniref:Rz1-like lysis system protein LysC n=1 Tax=unclassified Caballeronia TaxID=2646786 RepID=UPI002855D898|nr:MULTISPECIES: Rz1-like lysis system protein LysC [unclassified Caballeronia]MDR5776527.1 Rz1-like lysis system protein LysC [Caballeronia sp. LZ002]MDR5851962.1 Rz1-like lysis system protein LysC [Caballeronia sp. LZ003]